MNYIQLVKFYLNGKWIGLHKDPEFLYKIMRLLKCNSLIHIYTSIRWDTVLNEIYVFCDNGRLLRPSIFIETYGFSHFKSSLEGDYDKMNTWDHLIGGEHMYRLNQTMDIYDETYYRDEFMDIKLKHPNYIEYLIENQCMIEYIDPLESEGIFISKSIHSIDKRIFTL